MKRVLTALLLSSAMLCSLAVPALAAPAEEAGVDEDTSAAVAGDVAALPNSELYYGTITQLGRDETGALESLTLTSEAYGEYTMNLSADTVFVDSGNHTAFSPSELKVGEDLFVFHDLASTRSLPPQSTAYAVVRNVPTDGGSAMYHVVCSILAGENGRTTLITDNGGLCVYADASTPVTSYADGKTLTLADVKAGDRVMAWYFMVMESYPGQTYAERLMVLPAATEDPAPAEDGPLTIVLEGDMVLPVSGQYENGTALVPVAAVAQALGYQVTYTPGTTSDPALVTVESDQFQVRLSIGENHIIGVTKIEDAVGMTAPMDYGKAPYIVDPGTTWAPAQLFEMLGRSVTLDGNTLEIQ